MGEDKILDKGPMAWFSLDKGLMRGNKILDKGPMAWVSVNDVLLRRALGE
jgi:hypothetical protein